jgi:hypothetical protein
MNREQIYRSLIPLWTFLAMGLGVAAEAAYERSGRTEETAIVLNEVGDFEGASLRDEAARMEEMRGHLLLIGAALGATGAIFTFAGVERERYLDHQTSQAVRGLGSST